MLRPLWLNRNYQLEVKQQNNDNHLTDVNTKLMKNLTGIRVTFESSISIVHGGKTLTMIIILL